MAAKAAGTALPPWPLLAALAAVAALGYWDDRARGLPARLRMALQIAAAAVVAWRLGPLEYLPLPEPLDVPIGWFGWPLTIIWIVAVLNLYNFLDGIDGFAGLQGAVAGLGFAVLPVPGEVRVLGLAAAGACLGFLRWNWHPAKIFMGDVGSTMLGFLYASAPLLLEPGRKSQGIIWCALLLWFFLADGTFTILRRLSRGEKIWEAHRSHLYQRLVQTGMKHSEVSARVGLLMTALGAITVLLAWSGVSFGLTVALAAGAMAFAMYWAWVCVREKRISG
jgi:Fuc2NAc and GlcNAc transferase